jgi:hypothetical protein
MPAKERKLTKARCCTVSKTKHKAKQNKACLSGGCHLNQKRKARAHEHDTGNRANKARCSNMQQGKAKQITLQQCKAKQAVWEVSS